MSWFWRFACWTGSLGRPRLALGRFWRCRRPTRPLMREVLAQAALARDDGPAAQLHGRELASLAQRTGSPRLRALSDYVLGGAAIIDGE